MATKKRAPLRAPVERAPAAAPPPPKPEPKPAVSIYLATPLPPVHHKALAACDRLVVVSKADACSPAAKRHARVWVAEYGRPIPPRPEGQRVARIRRDDDIVAKILAAAE